MSRMISTAVAFALLCAGASAIALGQQMNPRAERKFGVGGQLLGPTILLSGSVNYFVTHNINIEVGAGALGFFGGARFYFGSKRTSSLWSPCVGAFATYDYDLDLENPLLGFYAPVGVQHMAPGGFTFAVEAAVARLRDDQTVPVWAALKLGKNF